MLYRWDENEIKYSPSYTQTEQGDGLILYDSITRNSMYYASDTNFTVQGDKFSLNSNQTRYVSGGKSNYNPLEIQSTQYFIFGLSFNNTIPTLGDTMYLIQADIDNDAEIYGNKHAGADIYDYGIYVTWPHRVRIYTLSPGPGELNQYVYSADSSTYPTNGKQGDYWYFLF